jgi:hypothetical protein
MIPLILTLATEPPATPSPAAHGALVCGKVSNIHWGDKDLVFNLEALIVTDTTTQKTSWPPMIARWTFTTPANRLGPEWFDREGFKTGSVAMIRLYLPEKPCAEPCRARAFSVTNMVGAPTGFMGSSGTAPPPGLSTAPLPMTHCP